MMGEKEKRRACSRAYRERPVTGGVLAITNKETGRMLLLSELDLQGCRNRFAFSVATNLCTYPQLQADWNTFGKEVFEFSVLEEMEKKAEQTDKEFRADLDVLLELWREKLSGTAPYYK